MKRLNFRPKHHDKLTWKRYDKDEKVTRDVFLNSEGISEVKKLIRKWYLPFSIWLDSSFALQKHVQDHSKPGEDVRVAIEKSFCNCNWLHSITSKEAAETLVDKMHHLLAKGSFELRQWVSNDPSIVSHLPPEVRSNSCDLWLSYGRLHRRCPSDTLSHKLCPVDCSATTMRNISKVLASRHEWPPWLHCTLRY